MNKIQTKVLYLTGNNPKSAGDFQEVIILHGLRHLLGESCIDLPKKKIMYRDFSESPQTDLHGKGFTLYTKPIDEINNKLREDIKDIDYILYGVTNAYGVTDYSDLNKLTPNIWYLDGHDAPTIQKIPCFKREMFVEQKDVYPTGFGIPIDKIIPLNFDNKIQMCQNTAPPYAIFNRQILGVEARGLYIYNNENDYYDDMQKSWFGLTCKKGGWDSLRHYEILATGACLLFRDCNIKPVLCSPQNLPCFSYSTKDELTSLMNKLIVNNKPTDEYKDMVYKQRAWLLKHGTTITRAQDVLNIMIENNKG